jgi:pimeloyl-ACP methyl ester carboxylesterase
VYLDVKLMGMALPTTGRIAVLDGVQLYYEVYGSGEPLVLLHGFMGSSLDWAALAAEWAAHFQVIVPDIRWRSRKKWRRQFRMRSYGLCRAAGMGRSAGSAGPSS